MEAQNPENAEKLILEMEERMGWGEFGIILYVFRERSNFAEMEKERGEKKSNGDGEKRGWKFASRRFVETLPLFLDAI